MKFTLLVVGRTVEKHYITAINDYAERTKHYISFDIEVIPELKNTKSLSMEQQKEKVSEIKGEQKENGWGSQIRSYVFQPYTMVKDLRTSYEMGNIGAVMDGEINGFINAYLKAASLGQLNLK